MKTKLYLILLFILNLSCSNHHTISFQWKKGDSKEALHKVQSEFNKASSVSTTNKFKTEFSNQFINNIKIDHTFLKVIYDKNEQIVFAKALYTNIKSINLEKLNYFQSVFPLTKSRLINEFLNENDVLENFEIMYYPINRNMDLAWSLIITHSSGETIKRVFDIDLNLLETTILNNSFHNVKVNIFPNGPKKSELKFDYINNLIASNDLVSDNIRVSSLAPVKFKIENNELLFQPGEDHFDLIQTLYIIKKSLNWFSSTIGLKLNSNLNIQLHTGYPDKTNAAFYYNSNIRLGTGDGQIYSKIPQDPSIVIHESVHAFIDQLSRLPNSGEGGSINEGFADFFTAIQLINPKMGEVAYLKAPYKRNLETYVKLNEKNDGLYHDSLIISGFLWDIFKITSLTKSVDYSLKILNQMAPNSTFEDFKKAANSAKIESFVDSELENVNKILIQRGF